MAADSDKHLLVSVWNRTNTQTVRVISCNLVQSPGGGGTLLFSYIRIGSGHF